MKRVLMGRRLAPGHSSSNPLLLLLLLALILIPVLHPVSAAAPAPPPKKTKVIQCPKSCDPGKGTCEGQKFSASTMSVGAYTTSSLGTPVMRSSRSSQYVSYCEMEQWLGVPEGIVKTLKAIDKYFIASEKFASATNFLVNQTAPYLIKPPCAKVSGETRTDCVPLSQDLIVQITSGKPITSAIDLALFVADFVCGKELEEGQKKMLPSFKDIKSNGQFVIDTLAIGPAVKDAKKVVKKGVDLRTPIPTSVTSKFALMNVALDNIELIAGLGVQYVRETTGLCKPVEPDYKEPPVDKIRHPAVKCFRPFLDRAVKYVQVINMELQSINGFLASIENDFILAALRARGLTQRDLPKSFPASRSAACRAGFTGTGIASTGRRLLQMPAGFKPQPADMSQYHVHVQSRLQQTAHSPYGPYLNSSGIHGPSRTLQEEGSFCLAWPTLPDLTLRIPALNLEFPAVDPFRFPGLPGPIPLPSLPALPSFDLELPPLPWVNVTIKNPFSGLNISIPNLPGINFTFPKLSITIPDLDLELAGYDWTLPGFDLDIPGFPKSWRLSSLPGFKITLPDLPGIPLPTPMPGWPDLPKLPLPDVGFTIPIPGIPSFKLNLKLPDMEIPVPQLPDFDIRIPGISPLKIPGFKISLPGFNTDLPDFNIDLDDWIVTVPGLSGFKLKFPSFPPIDVSIPDLPALNVSLPDFDFDIDLPGLPKPLPRLRVPDLLPALSPPIGLPDLIPEFPGLPRLPDIAGLNVSLPDFLPDVDVDLTALYRALYAKLNITLPVPDLPTVNLRLLLRGINLNLGDLLPRFGIDVPHIIIAGMSPAPNLLTFLPNLDVNITDIFGGVNITLPSIPAVSIRLSTLLAGLSPPPSLPDLFGPITIDMDALLRNLRINMPNLPPLPPLPKIKIGLPDFLPLIPGISPPLSLSGLLPKVTVRLPALPSVNVDLWRFLKKWSVTIIELLQAFKITLPKIPYPNVELPRMFLGIQPPIGLPDLMPALDINWPSLPNIPGFRISLSLLLPDVEIDLVALLKKLDPRIQFPLGFPNPYKIRLPDVFAGFDINLPDLPKFGNVTLPRMYVSAMGLSGFILPDLLPSVNITLPELFRGFRLSLPDLPQLPDVTLPDLLAGLQPPLRLPDLLGDIKINLGDLIPRLNIPNMPPMPTPFLEISLKDLLPNINLSINLDLRLPALPRIRLPKLPRVSLNIDPLLRQLKIGLRQLFALFKVDLSDIFDWFKIDLGDLWGFPKLRIPTPSLPNLNLAITPFFPPINLELPSFNFSLPPVNVDIPWFSLSLPNLTLDVDASAPIEAAAVIIDTAAGVVRESTKLLPMIDNVLTMIGWNDLKEFLNFVMGIVDLVKNQLLNTLDIIISIVDKIVNALQHIQCPEEISFICVIGDLIQGAIKDILKAIEDAVDLEGWVKKIISILPIDELLKVFKSVADFLGKMNPAGLFMEKLKIEIEKWIDQFIDMFVPYIDLGQFNPLNGLFCEGDATKLGTPWLLRPGIYKKAATRLAGNPMTFLCPGDYYPVVDTAERRMWMCTQRLSVLMRLPCPAGASTCTVDYDTKYGDTVCKQPEVSGLPQGEELTAYREMYGVDRLDGEDVFKATYLCVPKNMTFNVIAELMNIEVDTSFKLQANTWEETDQRVLNFTSSAISDGTMLPKMDCSGGGRLVHVEYLTGPSYSGKYLWHPCHSGWVQDMLDAAEDNLQQQRIRELCAYILAGDNEESVDPETYTTNDLSSPDNGGWRTVTQLPYTCMGDASGVYWVHMFGFDNPPNGHEGGQSYFRYVNSYRHGMEDYDKHKVGELRVDTSSRRFMDSNPGCMDENFLWENNGRYWKNADGDWKQWPLKDGEDGTGPKASEMTKLGGIVGKHQNEFWLFEIWNPEIWCEANFPALEPGVVNRVEGDSWYAQGVDAKSGECAVCSSPGDGADCDGVDALKYWKPKGGDVTASLTSRQEGRKARLALWNDFMSKFGPGKKGTQASIQYHDECMQSIKDCEGQPSCSFARCQPGLLQLSCIEDLYFQADPGYSNSSRLVYIFGDSKTTKVRTAQCPEGMLLRVKLAEAGSGIKSFDASKETVLQQQCPVGSNSCTFDFSKFKEYKGQALRVEYVCECPKGYSPLPATDPRNPSGAGACVRCMPGTYRTETDAACMLCPPGTYSGVVQRGEECVPCPAGTYAATAGQSTCNVCGQGTYSAPGAAICRPCTGNTYQDSMGAAACEPCAPGFFVPPSNYSRLACDACPTGTYRSAALAVCTPCAVGSMANTTGMGQCTACPAGYYSSSTGQAACSPCPIGTYQDKTGQAGCVACAKGYYTAKSASTAAAACSLKDAPIDYDALAVQVALQYAQGRTVTTRVATNRNAKNRKPVTGRGLLQITAPATPSELAAAKTQTLTYNATICQAMLRALGAATGLTELGNGICNGGPFNTAVCGWDRGDCCEATCNPNKDMAFSCAATNMQCRDPTVIARAARGGYASVLDCTLPGSQQKTPEPANAPATCPAAAGQGGRGNGVCDDDLNIAACNYDDGDCCPSTCKRSYIDISCSPDLFNCRDKAANTDTVPPTLWGVPMPADEVFFKTFSSLQRTSALEPTSEVSASDNYPCFDGVVTVTDVNVALTSKTAAQCNDKVLFNIKRTWSAKDAAGNVATATRTYSIVDDQDSIMIGNIMVPVASPTSALPFARQTLSLGTTAPNKIYTWTLTPRPGVSGKVVTKTGGTVSVTISNTASTGAELVATATGNSVYDVTVRTAYAGCVAPVTTIKVGTLTVMVTGQPLAALSPASASIRLSGSVTFVASQSLNPNAGTGSGITYAWVVRNAAGTAVITKPASATLSQLNILGTQLGQTRAPTTAVAFNVTVTIVTVTGQSATAAASLTLTA